jgi:hypothetical protein
MKAKEIEYNKLEALSSVDIWKQELTKLLDLL